MNQSELNASFANNEAYVDTLVSDMREPESFGVEALRNEAYATYGIDQAEAYASITADQDAANQSRTEAYENAVATQLTEREIRERNEQAAQHIGHAAQLIAGYYRVFELSPENK